ncbi:MAG: hypothetical protein JRI95_14295 [Deltaproteobacteria bacterium]|nr:hypothetical protein [Deltaproteobacteria bacterium]
MTRDDELGARIIAEAAKITRLTSSMENVGKITMAIGRGGTGKSTFVALLARYLKTPLLLLDIDPDQSLANMLGVELEETRVKTEINREVSLKTLSDLAEELENEDAFFEMGAGPPFVKIPLLLKNYSYYRSEKFDLFSLGPRWTEGDYRSASFLFEFIIPTIGQHYKNILIDSPAGLEHLNRRVVPRVDDLFVILDPSLKSIKHVERVKKIAQAVELQYEHLYLVGNHEFYHEAEQLIQSTGEVYMGKLDYDAVVRDYNLKGKSLWELPPDSTACLSIKELLARADYEI